MITGPRETGAVLPYRQFGSVGPGGCARHVPDGVAARPARFPYPQSSTTLPLDMHPISEPVIVSVGPNNRKDPGGLSGFVLIAESHISIHTFPRRGFVTADVYSCQDDLDCARLEHAFATTLGATSCETFEVVRERHYPAADI